MQRDKYSTISHMKSKTTETENRLVVDRNRGWGRPIEEMGEGGERVQTSSKKMITFWGYNIQHGDYS